MQRRILAFAVPFLLLNTSVSGENSPVWVFFKDKGYMPESVYRTALQIAGTRISRRALERRQKHLSAENVVGWRDLPVHHSYVERIEELGAVHRVSSNWLNCASFDMLPATLEKVRKLAFVDETREVEVYTKGMSTLSPSTPEVNSFQFSVGRDYGPSDYQLNMLGVPQLHTMGYTGAGVRIGVLDTGFELTHSAFDSMVVIAEHDFLSAERLWVRGMGTAIHYYQIEHIDAWEGLSGAVHVAFQVTDSAFNREIYYAYTEDAGITWNGPVDISRTDTGYSSVPSLVVQGDSSFVAWQDDDPHRSVGFETEDVYVWNGVNDTVINISADPEPSLWPALRRTAGQFHLVWAGRRTLRCAQSGDGVTWDTATAIELTHPVTGVALATEGDSLFVALTDSIHQLFLIQSTDRGRTWASTLVATESECPDICTSRGAIHIVCKNRTDYPLFNLSYLYGEAGACGQSTNLWTAPRPAVGKVSIAAARDSVWVVYEDRGYVCEFAWRSGTIPAPGLPVDTLTPDGFCYSPELTQTGLILWKRCGDDTTQDQAGDARGQMFHGTAMLSLIGAAVPGELYGPALGSEFVLAKTEKIGTAEGDYFEYEVEEDWWVKGLEWAEGFGVDVVSSSLGYQFVDYTQLDGNTAVTTRASDIAANLGVLVVNAVGNRREHLVTSPQDWVVAPADADSVLAAGGTNGFGEYDDVSAYGPLVDGRDKPEVVTCHEARIAHSANPDSFSYGSGTSCATALIAGMCALVLEARPSWTNMDLRRAVMHTGSLAPTVNPDTMRFGQTPNDSLGWGVPNATRAIGYTAVEEVFDWQGHGSMLARSYPNPFTSSTTIHFSSPYSGSASLTIYDISGRVVTTLFDGDRDSGHHALQWDGRNVHGRKLPPGIYFARIELRTMASTVKMTLIE
ncbi:hypothetical protein AMJ40_01685 [candidate division TA06 bacterium DG_26]|uniref:Peptidase S8/S53 domain-containing protein n=1 Tax=candidate division TA06 bacterium DG_26 TaxID=1703771 RepID=A0A0S7WL01_UNCT6|nr:MAG: hypothetical protein AMJ40_01685 [candidate division TA06 bacterium DG_26]